MMTDGHSCQLSQRSVVGIGVAKGEVKGAEDHYAWSTIDTVADEEPAVMALAKPGRSCKDENSGTGQSREDESGPCLAVILQRQMRQRWLLRWYE